MSQAIILLAGFVLFAFGLRLVYLFHRYVRTGYYSFSELVTGIPTNLTWSQLILIRLFPPIIIGYLAYLVLSPHTYAGWAAYSLIGTISALMNIVPSIFNILKTSREEDWAAKSLPENLSRIVGVYIVYLISFTLLTALGAYLASTQTSFLPSTQGLVDGLWAALLLALMAKMNKPLE